MVKQHESVDAGPQHLGRFLDALECSSLAVNYQPCSLEVLSELFQIKRNCKTQRASIIPPYKVYKYNHKTTHNYHDFGICLSIVVKVFDITALFTTWGHHGISNIPRCIEGSQCANVINNRLASSCRNSQHQPDRLSLKIFIGIRLLHF